MNAVVATTCLSLGGVFFMAAVLSTAGGEAVTQVTATLFAVAVACLVLAACFGIAAGLDGR